MGYRYRVNVSKLPGKPDIVFSKRKKAIFVHGCFWHCHDNPICPNKHIPQSKQEYWLPKLEKTVQRDNKNLLLLKEMGWDTLIIWECQLNVKANLINILVTFLGKPR
jgi:DNA mismatch endonuclease (patch repair protein)